MNAELSAAPPASTLSRYIVKGRTCTCGMPATSLSQVLPKLVGAVCDTLCQVVTREPEGTQASAVDRRVDLLDPCR